MTTPLAASAIPSLPGDEMQLAKLMVNTVALAVLMRGMQAPANYHEGSFVTMPSFLPI